MDKANMREDGAPHSHALRRPVPPPWGIHGRLGLPYLSSWDGRIIVPSGLQVKTVYMGGGNIKSDASSFRRTLALWWGVYLVIQQAERFFLLPQAWSIETPTGWLLLKTLWIGLRADLIAATSAVLIAVIFGLVIGCALRVMSTIRHAEDTWISC